MNILNDLFNNAFIYSFGWTLIQSLWYGAIVSILTLIMLFFLRKQSSSIRYNFSVFSLIIIVALSIWTFASFYDYYYSIFEPGEKSFTTISTNNSTDNYGIFWFDLLPQIIRDNLDYFAVHLPMITTFWFVIVLFLSIKYMGAYTYSQRLKNNKVKPVKAYWIDKMTEYSTKINLKKKVQLLESAIVKVPVVIGYFKPAIIVPLGLFTGIPNEQIEAILIHELAHIKRNDYLVKLLQTVVEILFFFNPFVWWISSIINKERENCCDDLAISITQDNISFVKALAGLCELEAGNTSAALAFGKSNNQIIKRMERVMKKNENKNNFSHFTIAVLILVSSLVAFGTTSLKSVNIEQKSEGIQDSNKVKKAGMMKKADEKEIKMKKAMFEIQESMTKLKAALEEEKDPDTRKKYKEKLMQLEKKAKAIEMESAEAKEVKKEKVVKKDNAAMIDELRKKLSVTEDQDTRRKIEEKIKQLTKESELATPPPPPPPKVKGS